MVGFIKAECVRALKGVRSDRGAGNHRVVIYNCGAAQKYAHIPVPDLPMVRKDRPVDWARVAAGGGKQEILGDSL